MKKLSAWVLLISLLFACSACGGPIRPENEEQPPVPPSSSQEAPEPADPSSTAPQSEPSAPSAPASEEDSQSASGEEEPPAPIEAEPDPGTGVPAAPAGEDIVQRVEAMVAYLEETLTPWDYTELWPYYGEDGSNIDIITPTPDAVKSVVEAYTGEAVPVEYTPAAFSKGQLDQARTDLEQFLAEHPEIEVLEWRSIFQFDGYQITLGQENDAVAEFVKAYPVAGIYQVAINSNGSAMHPD